MSVNCLTRALVAATAVVASFAIPASAQTTSVTPEEKAAALAMPSIVYIETYYSGFVRLPSGELVGDAMNYASRCTGFHVGGGYIVTAGHCVDVTDEGANATFIEMALVRLVENGTLSQEQAEGIYEEALGNWKVEGRTAGRPAEMEAFVQWGNAHGGKKTGDALPARVLESKPLSQGDVAVLKIEKDLPALEVLPGKDLQIGTPVLAVGYPASSDEVTDQSVEPTFKDGKVSSKKTREGGLLPVYEVSAALSQGMSGGPTIDRSGRVIGLNSFMINGESQAFNFLSPASLITEMLSRVGAKVALSESDRAYRAGLQALWTGDGKTAVTKLQTVLDDYPTHPRAQEFMKQARTAAASQKSGLPVIPIAAGAAALLLVLIAVLVLKGRTAKAAPVYANAYVPPVTAIPAAASLACSNCGNALAGDAAFCAKCGTPIAQPVK